MRTACTDIEKDEASRLVPMWDFVAAFNSDAERLATHCMPETVGLPPAEIAARLGAALHATQEAAKEHDRLAKEIRATIAAVNGAEEEERLAWAEVQPLLASAKVTTVAELGQAIALADACRIRRGSIPPNKCCAPGVAGWRWSCCWRRWRPKT